jgi:hypothetical protein
MKCVAQKQSIAVVKCRASRSVASLAHTLDLRNPQMGWIEDRRLQAVVPGAGGITARLDDVVLVASLHVAYVCCQRNSVSSGKRR